MNKKTTGLIAGAAGAALLLGGGTFALWSDSAAAPAGTITAGSLDVTMGLPIWYDVSADRTDSPHLITPGIGDFRIIPGDTIEAHYPLTLDLSGENMLANLKLVLAQDETKAVTGDLADGLDVTYTVHSLNEDDEDVVVGTPNTANLDVLIASKDNGNAIDPTITKLVEFTTYTVVVTVTFDEATADRDLVNTTADLLAGASLELSQVREGFGYVPTP